MEIATPHILEMRGTTTSKSGNRGPSKLDDSITPNYTQ